MPNISFLITAYIVSMFVDWVFQWQWQAVNKSKWGKDDNKLISFMAVTSHSFIYAVITTFALVAMRVVAVDHFLLVLGYLFITHTVIDTRIPVKWIMKFKYMTDEEINDYKNYGFMHIGIDHRLHELSLLALSFLI